MARIESIAVGGYYKTPSHLLPSIACRIGIDQGDRYAFLDPCAGEGEALLGIVDHVFTARYGPRPEGATLAQYKDQIRLYGIEMEEHRYNALRDNLSGMGLSSYIVTRGEVLRGDAFRATVTPGSARGASLLYLNPPYDLDKEHRRLEERFLSRFTPALRADGGVLIFVVPYYALAASAATIAAYYQSAVCFRFPEPDWSAYKQVVLYARRREHPTPMPDPALREKVERWSQHPETMSVLTPTSPVLGRLPRQGVDQKVNWRGDFETLRREVGFVAFDMELLDVQEIRRHFRLWHRSDRGGELTRIDSVLPDPVRISRPVYPSLMPLREGYIAAGIAARVLNGERVGPNDPMSGLPDLLVKGVFDREYQAVEEKTDEVGTVTGEVQVQQPKLTVTVLDLSTSLFHTLTGTVESGPGTGVASMTVGDLLNQYGQSIMGLLRAHCPVTHDPTNPDHVIPVAELQRPYYSAQRHAVMAAVKGFQIGGVGRGRGSRRYIGRSVPILGEVGTGKTQVALGVLATIESRRPLVMCPPHLLQGWCDQTKTVWGVPTRVIETISDADAFAADQTEGPVIGILSRETAKLGHGWVSVTKRCPKCGRAVPSGDLAKRRMRCTTTEPIPQGRDAWLLFDVALAAYRLFPEDTHVRAVVQYFAPVDRSRERELERRKKESSFKDQSGPKARLQAMEAVLRSRLRCMVDSFAMSVLEGKVETWTTTLPVRNLLSVLHYLGDDSLICSIALRLFEAICLFAPKDWELRGGALRYTALRVLSIAAPRCEVQLQTLAAMEKLTAKYDVEYGSYFSEGCFEAIRRTLTGVIEKGEGYVLEGNYDEGEIHYEAEPRGSIKTVMHVLDRLYTLGSFTRTRPCGEPLYQAIPEPRRYPLSLYLSKRHRRAFDCLVLDEGHEYAADGSAQSRSAHRLVNAGNPVLFLTGSVMNGYAESLFTNWWSLFRDFRKEFGRGDLRKFNDRYGYRRRLVQDVDKETGEVVEFGAYTDRVIRREKDLGVAPGVLPLFLLTHLLPRCVTLHKADLKLDLPPCTEIPVDIQPDEDQRNAHVALLDALFHQIQEDRFTERSGKLWGQVNEAPSHPDRCTDDAGNCETGDYEVRYPSKIGGALVYTAKSFPRLNLLPKERWLLELFLAELAEERRTCVFSWHTELLPRYARLLQDAIGKKTKMPVLTPQKVPTAKRQDWIDQNVVGPQSPGLLTNPICVQTGLNNLVWMQTVVWMENPACNPIAYRQANGRFDRIGQKKPVRIYFPRYTGTSQPKAHQLLLHKVGVSLATDGLDAESAFQAAGIGQSGLSGFAVGKELYRLLVAT